MTRTTQSLWLATVAPLVLGACSLSLNTDAKQCKTNADCQHLDKNTLSTYQCQASYCVQPGCTTDADCRMRGGVYDTSICEASLCKPAECREDKDCAEDQACDVAAGRCGPRECDVDADCQAKSQTPTAMCMAGKCSDLVWSCIAQADDREKPTSGTATFRATVLGVTTKAAIPDLEVRVCGAGIDFDCISAPTGTSVTHDPSTGKIEITGLPQDIQLHLRIKATGYFETDFFTNRKIRGITEEPTPLLLIPPDNIPTIAALTGINVDTTNNGTLIVRVFDCQEPPVPAAGITLAASEGLPDTEVFYVENDLPDPDAQQTTSYGAGGIANLKATKQITVTASLPAKVVAKLIVSPFPNRMTYLNLYPRDYDKK